MAWGLLVRLEAGVSFDDRDNRGKYKAYNKLSKTCKILDLPSMSVMQQ